MVKDIADRRLVQDYTVQLIHIPHSFGIQGRLILDIAIDPYSITRSPPFLYFTLHVKPRLETSQGAPPQHQTSGNANNASSLDSPSARKGATEKINLRIFYSSQYRTFPYFSSFFAWAN